MNLYDIAVHVNENWCTYGPFFHSVALLIGCCIGLAIAIIQDKYYR